MTDAWQSVRDYAQAQLAKFDDRGAFLEDVIKHAAATAVQQAPDDVMMAERIARHAWDSTPHKVIPHAHLPPAQIPAGAKSPTGILKDADRTIEAARRIREASAPKDGGTGQPSPGAPTSSEKR